MTTERHARCQCYAYAVSAPSLFKVHQQHKPPLLGHAVNVGPCGKGTLGRGVARERPDGLRHYRVIIAIVSNASNAPAVDRACLPPPARPASLRPRRRERPPEHPSPAIHRPTPARRPLGASRGHLGGTAGSRRVDAASILEASVQGSTPRVVQNRPTLKDLATGRPPIVRG